MTEPAASSRWSLKRNQLSIIREMGMDVSFLVTNPVFIWMIAFQRGAVLPVILQWSVGQNLPLSTRIDTCKKHKNVQSIPKLKDCDLGPS